jgi:hypothetical protein
MDEYENFLIQNSDLKIDRVFRKYHQMGIDLLEFPRYSNQFGIYYSRSELLAINFSEYIQTYSLSEKNFGGISPDEISSKYQSVSSPIIVQKDFINVLGFNINDEILIQSKYCNNTNEFRHTESFQIIGVFSDLPGLVPFDDLDRSLIVITDFGYTYQNFTYTPIWNGCSLLIDYNFEEEVQSIPEKEKIIQESEKEIIRMYLGLNYQNRIEKKYDELYTEYLLQKKLMENIKLLSNFGKIMMNIEKWEFPKYLVRNY